tara:strand:- start:13019 stop:13447 length:429 start_codon:yes stop_codon:yes gene_type:complete
MSTTTQKKGKKTSAKRNKKVNEQIISQTETVNILKGLSVKIDVANAQILNLGLLVEYLYEKLEEAEVNLDVDNFPTWAEARHKEIQDQAETMMKEGLVDDLKGELEKAAGINFDEETNLANLGDKLQEQLEKVMKEQTEQQE